MSGEDHADTSTYLPVRRPDPIVRAVTVSEIIEALADGLRDFQSAPIYGLTFGALYAAGGILIVLSVSALGASYLAYPLAAGFALIGPFVAVALYEVSRRRETGQPLSWTAVIGTSHAGLARTRVDGLRDRVCLLCLDVPDSAPHRPFAGAEILRFAEKATFLAHCDAV